MAKLKTVEVREFYDRCRECNGFNAWKEIEDRILFTQSCGCKSVTDAGGTVEDQP